MNRNPSTDKIKKAVFERDKYTCQYCGKKSTDIDLEIHHIKPLSQGGSNEIENLTTTCANCHRLQHWTLDEYLKTKERETKARRLWAWMSLAIAIVGLTVSMFASLFTNATNKSSSLVENRIEQQFKELDMRLREQEKISTQVVSDLKAATNKNNLSTGAMTGQRLAETENRLKSLEAGLSADPVKALSIPLLRKDIEGLEKSVASDVAMLKREVDRIYDQSKWFIGLMVTMLLTLIGLAVSTLVSTRK